MAVEIKVPSVGESITEGIIARWLKKAGELVRANEPVFELETDKATTEVVAPVAGILQIRSPEGSKVQIGSVVGSIEPAGNGDALKAEKKKPAELPPSKRETPSAPAARQLIADHALDPARIPGSGPGGRILKEDVLAHLETATAVATPPEPASVSSPPPPPPRPESPPTLAPAGRSEKRERMSAIRQRIAARLVEAQSTAAILSTFNEIDMQAVMDLRARYREPFQKKHGVALGFMSFFVKACVEALRAFPMVNARIEGNEIVTPNYHDIGVAVSTDKGLMVPVLRDAGNRSFAEIEKAIAELALKARDGKISVSDLQGGTFTITNGGIFGSLLSTPILNPPQSGILGMHAIKKRPVVIDDQIVARPMMYVALSYDHRLIDGREAVGFLIRVKECIENPERMLLEV